MQLWHLKKEKVKKDQWLEPGGQIEVLMPGRVVLGGL